MADSTQIGGGGPVSVAGAFTTTGNLTVDRVLFNQNGLPNVLLGLNPHFVYNFGGDDLAAGSQALPTQLLNVKTPVNTLLKLSLSLAEVASQEGVVSAAQASQIFAATATEGTDFTITNAAQNPISNLKVIRMKGGISGTVNLTAAADLTPDQSSLLVFTDNVCSSSGVLTLLTEATQGFDAESTEVAVTGDGNAIMTRAGAPTDNHRKLILTDTGDCTILAGSFLYFYAEDTAADAVTLKGCIRTSGGTIAVTYAAS